MRWRPERGAAPRKILVIQLRRIGDAVLITPALDAIRDAWPAAEIHLLTSGAIPDLFENDPRVARIWTEPRGRPVGWLVLEIRRARFDLVLDFQSIPLTAGLSLLSGAYAVGFEKPYRRFCYRRVVSRLPQIPDHKCVSAWIAHNPSSGAERRLHGFRVIAGWWSRHRSR